MGNSCQPFVAAFNSLFSVEIVVGPSAGMGMGKMRRGQRWPTDQRNSISRWITKGRCWFVVSRVLDAFDKDATGVSALQHAYVFVLVATFSPTECLIAPVSYLPRAAPDGMEPHADFGPLRHFGKGDRGLSKSPVPLFETLSNGTGAPYQKNRWLQRRTR
jgi:hypothetical protein